MKTFYKKSIIPSLLTICFLLTVLVGATFALFTDQANINIAVTAGNVDVEAEITDFKIYSLDVLQEEIFENGGTAVIDGTTITLTNVTPGDKVEFNIVIKNKSNVIIDQSTIITSEGELFAGLNVTINGSKYDGSRIETELDQVLPNSADVVIPVVIELPVDAGNEWQGKTCSFEVLVNVIQGNGNKN